MEAYTQERRELEKQPDNSDSKLHQQKMAELTEIREQLYKAKDNAMQSWLDSKPLIDELEKLQANVASAKNRTSMSNIIISELQSQLEATDKEIKSKMEDEAKSNKIINEITETLQQKYQESELMKFESDEERRTRSKLKQDLRIKKQSLRTLQLMLRAIKIESEAFAASEAETGEIKSSLERDKSNTIVRVSLEDYKALKRGVKEETALAKRRVSVSMEQRLAAEESKNFALSILKELERRKSKEEQEKQEKETSFIIEDEENNSGIAFPKARAEEIGKGNRRKPRKEMGKSARKGKKKKLSVFMRIRSFLVRSIAKLFG